MPLNSTLKERRASDSDAEADFLDFTLKKFIISANETAEIMNIILNSNYEACRKPAERVGKGYCLGKILFIYK